MSGKTTRNRLRRLSAIAALALGVGLFSSGQASAQGVIDQSYECLSQIFQIQFYSPVGQSFIPTRPNMNAVEVLLYDMNTPHADTITMRLHQGTIDGPVLATGAQFFQVPPSNLWARYDFTPIAVVPGNTYVIELAATNVSWGWVARPSQNGIQCADYPFGSAIGNFGNGLAALDWNFHTYSLCGDGDLDLNEQCDQGAANGTPGSCCTAQCTIVGAGTQCRAANGECDTAEACNGSSGACPADSFKPAGTGCTDDGSICSADQCDGAGACIHPATNAGTVCRAAAGVCDVAETCNGVNPLCPADGFAPAGTACTSDGDACTADRCDGSGTCQHPDLPDSDGDSVCDQIDPCTNVAGAQDFVAKPAAKLMLTKVAADPTAGNDGFKLTGAFDLPISFATVDLTAQGGRVVILNHTGGVVLDQVLPPGPYLGGHTRGWRRAGGTVWQFIDKIPGGLGASGTIALKLIDQHKVSPGRVKVVLSGKNATLPVASGDEPLDATVTLGSQLNAIAGVCGEATFASGECTFNQGRTSLICKK